MKKGLISLLLVATAFVCIMLGVLIGRSTVKNIYSVDGQAGIAQTSDTQMVSNGLLDINTATAAELTDLPGIGDTLASRIIAYRTAKGPFSNVDDLLFVEGIGKAKLDAIRNYITVGGQYEDTGSR